MAAVIGFSFKERFLRFRLLFPDFYHLHHFIWGMKLAKKLKTKNGQNMSSGPFSHDAAHISNERKSVSSDIQTPRSGLKKRGAGEFFLFNQL